MGNSNTTLSIVLNPSEGSRADCYNAGSKLSGTVYAKTNKKVDDFGLKVIFTGKESCKVVSEIQDNSTNLDGSFSPSTKTSRSSRDICSLTVPLVEDHSSLINAGQYAYPFEIALPDELPMSICRHAIENSGYCKTAYKIQAETTGTWEHKIKKSICVLAKPETSVTHIPRLVSDVYPQNKIIFSVNVDNIRVRRGENVTISFGCKNRSSTRIKEVSVKLVQTVEWFSGGMSQEAKKVIVKQYYPIDEGMMMIWHTKSQKNQFHEYYTDFTNRSCSELFETVRAAGTNQMTLTIPDNILTSSYSDNHSNLVTVFHELVLKLKTPLFSSSNPEKRIRIWILDTSSVTEGCKSVTTSAPLPLSLWEGQNGSTTVSSPMTNYSENEILHKCHY